MSSRVSEKCSRFNVWDEKVHGWSQQNIFSQIACHLQALLSVALLSHVMSDCESISCDTSGRCLLHFSCTTTVRDMWKEFGHLNVHFELDIEIEGCDPCKFFMYGSTTRNLYANFMSLDLLFWYAYTALLVCLHCKICRLNTKLFLLSWPNLIIAIQYKTLSICSLCLLFPPFPYTYWYIRNSLDHQITCLMMIFFLKFMQEICIDSSEVKWWIIYAGRWIFYALFIC